MNTIRAILLSALISFVAACTQQQSSSTSRASASATQIESDFPVTAAPGNVDGSPKIVKKQLGQGAEQWGAEWEKDNQERQLVLSYVRAPDGIPKRAEAKQLFPRVFEQGLSLDKNEADVREEGSGQTQLWGLSGTWALGSELAERNPFASQAASYEGGKAPRGPERRYCAIFMTYESDGKEALSGMYCKVMPAGLTVSEADALGWLQGLQLTVQ
jgi:hypothetical protein